MEKSSTKISEIVVIETQELIERKTWAQSHRKTFKWTQSSSSQGGNSFT